MHIAGSRTMRRVVGAALLRPARGLLRRLGAGRAWHALAPTPARPAPAPGAPEPPALAADEWLWLQHACSERGGSFFSDNLVSNESSYLQAAAELAAQPKGQAYVGVGPEQTLSYLALLEPALAFVVDLRRDNARLHWLYKALFLAADTRAEWLGLLLGRPHRDLGDLRAEATVEEVTRAVERLPPSDAAFAEAHALVCRRLDAAGCPLGRRDARRLGALHRAIARCGLELRFELRGPSRHRYPTLRSMLLARSPDGRLGSFLADEAGYRSVRCLQQQNRVVPLVGDLAGQHALGRIASELRRRALEVGVVYVSNVEQYLFEQRTWRWWLDNLAQLPLGPRSLVLRSYLDQGRPHPRQLPGHRITSVAQLAAPLLAHEHAAGYRSYWEVVTAPQLDPEKS
jgi:hypothetical protein